LKKNGLVFLHNIIITRTKRQYIIFHYQVLVKFYVCVIKSLGSKYLSVTSKYGIQRFLLLYWYAMWKRWSNQIKFVTRHRSNCVIVTYTCYTNEHTRLQMWSTKCAIYSCKINEYNFCFIINNIRYLKYFTLKGFEGANLSRGNWTR